jgi:hypothetical protein
MIRNMAKGLLQRGIAYLYVWGPDCERVHDQFDLERTLDEPKRRVVMTIWQCRRYSPKNGVFGKFAPTLVATFTGC